MTILQQWQNIQQQINDYSRQHHLKPEKISLLAVSKGQSIEKIEEAYQAGIYHFGENYWQEAKSKIANLQHLPLIWHFIGPLQSNKVSDIARNFSWVQSVDREKVARLLSLHRPSHLPPLNICIQVKLDEEEHKSGLAIEEVEKLAILIRDLPHLQLRGLMTIPQAQTDENQQFTSLHRLKLLFDQLNTDLQLNLDTLSMGMSDDYLPAIKAGSTMIRLGQALFGTRSRK